MAWMTVLLMKGHAVLDLTRKRKGELVYDFGCWLQWLWDGGVQDTERRDEGKQQDSSLGLQESEPWPARAVLARITWETTMEGGEFQDRCLVSNFISSSLKNDPFQWAGNQESSHCDRTHTGEKITPDSTHAWKKHVSGGSPVRWPRRNVKSQNHSDHSLFAGPKNHKPNTVRW